jgi:hypothetical protein
LLGIALARLGRRAAVERVLVVICALGSCGMNVLNANLGIAALGGCLCDAAGALRADE